MSAKVVFACVHNAGRSQMAAAFFNAAADPRRAVAISAGTQPAARVHPEVLEAMREVGIDLATATPNKLTPELARGAKLLVTMGCGEACPVVPGAEVLDWPLQDPKGQSRDAVTRIRDQVRERVRELVVREGWARSEGGSRPAMLDPAALSTRFLFFTGKGGVGKTTLACATALRLADQGARVLLVSTDPASNLDEMLGVKLGARPTPVPGAPRLEAMNVDPQAAADDYRRRALGPYEGVVSAEELATMREELAGACTVEIAAFDRFAGLLAGEDGSRAYDRVVFDTAPTGHTLRLLDLPRSWTSFLDANTRGASCLGPHGGLTLRHDRFRAARRALEDPALTTVVLVSRAETGALREAERTAGELATVGLKHLHLVINGRFLATDPTDAVARALEARERRALDGLPASLAVLPRDEVPLRPYEMLGVEALRRVLDPSAPAPVIDDGAPARTDLPRLEALVLELQAAPRGIVLVTGKGGVGKTTIAAALAVELAARGVDVHLCTTDPAAHLAETVAGEVPRLEVSRIDPRAEVARYVAHVLESKGAGLDADGRAALEEDLRSPCTEEVAVFHAFSRLIAQARARLVIVDTAPTGHTLLLLDATGSYHREVLRGASPTLGSKMVTPLMRLQDPAYTRVLLVTLAETTPVSEAAALQEDLRRAGIEPWAWVINASVAASGARDSLLQARAAIERRQLGRVTAGLARRCVLVPWAAEPPRGAAALRRLVVGDAGSRGPSGG